ncbi:MAG: murein hydrolase activator EnvC [Desulfovibrio sp.]
MRPLFFLASLCLLLAAFPARAQDVRKTLEQTREEAVERQGTLKQLEQKEAALHSDLQSVEAEIDALQRTVRQQEAELEALHGREEELRADYFRLEARRDAIGRDLTRLVRGIWPIHLNNTRNRLSGLTSWHEADRRFQWLAAVYRNVLAVMKEAARAALDRADNLRRQQTLSQEASKRLDAVNRDKDELLRRRLSLRSGLKSVQGEKQSLEAELQSILATIKQLNYQLKSQKTKRFSENKGFLPWPVQGESARPFAPSADPPRRGIGLRTAEAAPVQAVFWGKVVHNDILRGFGRVVILYHGNDYYSLYAFLSESPLSVGQEVEKDEPIGTTGIYPEVQGPGLYFELRFGQKPINPMVWLFPK